MPDNSYLPTSLDPKTERENIAARTAVFNEQNPEDKFVPYKEGKVGDITSIPDQANPAEKPVELTAVMRDPAFRGLPPEERGKVIDTLLGKDERFQALPKEEQAKVRQTLLPTPQAAQPKGFWQSLSEGGIEGFMKETLPMALGARFHDVREAEAKFQQAGEWDKERARRVEAGESLNGMEQWKLKRIDDLIQETKPQATPQTMGEVWEGVKKAAVDDPAGFMGKMARGFIAHPELLLTPEALPARMAELAGTAGKIGTEAAQIGAAAGAESVLEQLTQHGQTSPGQTAMDTVMAAAPVVGARALLPKAKAQVTMAADLALTKDAKTRGIEPSAELVRATVADTEARVAQGQPLDAALKDALESVKLSPEAAADAAELIIPTPKSEEPHAVDQKGQESNVSHDEGVRGQEGQASVLREREQGIDQGTGEKEAPIEPSVPTEPSIPPPEEKLQAPEESPKDAASIKAARQAYDESFAKSVTDEALAKMREERNVPPSQSIKINIGSKGQRTVEFPSESDKIVFQHGSRLARQVGASDTLARSLYESLKNNRPYVAKALGVAERDADAAARAYRQRVIDAARLMPEGSKLTAFGAKQKFNPESGRVDPALLKALGISGLVGGAAALYTQDPKDAVIGALAAGGVLAAGALLHRGVKAVSDTVGLWDKRYRITNLTNDYGAAVESGKLANYRFAAQMKALVSSKKDREALTHYLQGDESIRLTPEQEQAAKAVQHYFKTMGEKAQSAGVIDALREQYVTQLWTGLNKNDSLWRNLVQSLGKSNTFSAGMSPRSRFNMERVIPSYKEGMAKGLIPSTLDIADIVRIYGDNVATAIANKNFIAALKRDRMPTGERILGPADALEKDVAQAAARTRAQWDAKGPVADDIRRFAEAKVRNDYVLMNHPQMLGMVAHKDVAPVLKWFFDAKDPNAATKLAYGVSIAAKRGLFSFSFFHNASLLQAMLGTGLKPWVNVATGDAWRMLKSGRSGDVLDELVRGGLKISERPLEGDATPFSHALKLIGDKYPIIGAPAKGIQMLQKAMDGLLWGVLQPTLKTATGMAAFEKSLARGLSRQDAAKAAASFTNDMFGGLDWFKVADGVQNRLGRDLALAVTSPSGRRFMQILMLAPDWTVATARTLAKAIPDVSPREIAALHQGYVVRSALLYATIGDGLNMAFSGHHFWQNDDPTMIDLGDGRKLQLSKHFMEPIHWLLKPDQQALNKLGYVVKQPLEQALNQQYLSTKGAPPIVPKDVSKGAALAERAGHAFGTMMPITGQQAFEQGAMPALSGFFGFPVYGKTPEQSADTARANAETRGKDPNAAAEQARKRAQSKRDKAETARRVSQ